MNRRTTLLGMGLGLSGLAKTPRARAAKTWPDNEPLPVVVVGLVHGHVGGFFKEIEKRPELRVVGVQDPAVTLRQRRADRHKLDPALLYSSLPEMLAKTRPAIAFVFSNTQDHLPIVRACAQQGVAVMVEKPLAITLAEGRTMAALARKAQVPLLVNYETIWRPAHAEALAIARDKARVGELRKIVSMDGHFGPKEIGVEADFLDWLSDPVRNGGGALYDFGCYGASIITYLMDNQRPVSVTALTQQIKPEIYPKVDDEATIVLAYPRAQGIVQASWNWPVSRKDIEIYGTRGQVFTLNPERLRARLPNTDGKTEDLSRAAVLPPLLDRSPLVHMNAVIRGQTKASPLADLDNNLIVTEILETARLSAKSGRTIVLPPKPKA